MLCLRYVCLVDVYLYVTVITLTARTGQCTWLSPIRDLANETPRLQQTTVDYITAEKQRLQEIRRIITSRRQELVRSGNPTSDASVSLSGSTHRADNETNEFLAHPVNSFRLIKEWAELRKQNEYKPKKYIEEMYSKLRRSEIRVPTKSAIASSYKILLLIQTLYNISFENIISGNISGHESLTKLSKDDMFRMAKVAYENEDSLTASKWMTSALLQSDESYTTWTDNVIDDLLYLLRNMVHENMLPSSVVLEFERWIYVNNREEALRKKVVSGVMAELLAAKKGPQHTEVIPRYKPCMYSYDQLESTTLNGFKMAADILTEDKLDSISVFGNSLWKLSFQVEGMRHVVISDHILDEHRHYIDDVMSDIVGHVTSFCTDCDVQKALDTQEYSFEVIYQSAGTEGFSFNIETRDFKNIIDTSATSGVHVIIFGSFQSGGAVVPISGAPAIRPIKGSGLFWRTSNLTRYQQKPTWCPVLIGEAWGLHIFIHQT